MDDDKMQGTEHQDQLPDMSREELDAEIGRLLGVYPVVRFLDGEDIEKEDHCLLYGDSCVCMRGVCRDILHNGGSRMNRVLMGDQLHRALAQRVNVDGKPGVLMCARPVDAVVGGMLSQELLYHDALSGAYNRRFYEDNLRNQHVFAGVAVLDLDDFKLVNDTLGHHAGDVAIKTAVDVLRGCIRSSDMLVRYGGDEFVLVIPGISADVFARKLHDMGDKLAETPVPGYESINLTISIGGVLSEGRTVEEAVHQADGLMYKAKGRKNLVITDSDDLDPYEFHKPLLLVVDDSEMNRLILSEMLKDQYEIIDADCGEAGIACLEQHGSGVSLVLLDIVMPGVDGFDVLSLMSRNGWIDDIPVIMISSEDSDDTVLRAYELGASDYISRPFDSRIVRQRVSNIMRLYTKQRRLSTMLAQQFYERERESRMLVDIMGGAMELRNGESGPHVQHVRKLTEMMLEHLMRKTDRYHISSSERSTIAAASTLHDLGKLSIPDNILNKPGRLTSEEFEIMKTHTTIGADMLEGMVQYRDSALVDVYDALTSDRVYKKAFPHEKAMHMILNGDCGAFNPLLIDCLIDLQDRIVVEKDEQDPPPPISVNDEGAGKSRSLTDEGRPDDENGPTRKG